MAQKRTGTGLFRVEVAGVSDRHGSLRREGEILKYKDEPEDDDRDTHLDSRTAQRLFARGSIRELTEDEADDYNHGVGEHVQKDPSAPEVTTGNETQRGVGVKGKQGDLTASGDHSDNNNPTDNSEEALSRLSDDELRERARALNIEGRRKLDRGGLVNAIAAPLE